MIGYAVHWRNRVTGVGLLIAVMHLQACTSTQWQADHMDRNIDHITQEQVMETLGRPDVIQKGVAGGAMWVYHYTYATIGGTAVVGKIHCRENVLSFDHTGVLRNHERRACSIKSSSYSER